MKMAKAMKMALAVAVAVEVALPLRLGPKLKPRQRLWHLASHTLRCCCHKLLFHCPRSTGRGPSNEQ